MTTDLSNPDFQTKFLENLEWELDHYKLGDQDNA